MKETNLNIFYHFGAALARLCEKVSIGEKAVELIAYMYDVQLCISDFLTETKDFQHALKDSRASVEALLSKIQEIIDDLPDNPTGRVLTEQEVHVILGGKDDFEHNFEREHRNLDVFTVTPKAIYNTRLLIEHPDLKFPEKIRAKLPPQMLYDLEQAGRCLAFEIPTACAFHVFRGTEAVMLAYYELLATHAWTLPKRDWNIYIEQLIKEGAPESITNRLKEIRQDRNAYIHPDVNVTLEESPILFELCTGVVFLMGQEMSKLTL